MTRALPIIALVLVCIVLGYWVGLERANVKAAKAEAKEWQRRAEQEHEEAASLKEQADAKIEQGNRMHQPRVVLDNKRLEDDRRTLDTAGRAYLRSLVLWQNKH